MSQETQIPTAGEPEYIVRLTESEMQDVIDTYSGFTNMATQMGIRVTEQKTVKIMRTVHKFKDALHQGMVV